MRHVLLQVVPDLAPDNLLEAPLVVVNVEGHESKRWKMNDKKQQSASGYRVSAVGGESGVNTTYIDRRSSFFFSVFLFGVTTGEDARHVLQHIRRRFFVVPVVADQAAFDDVDLLLRFGIDDVRHQAG